jgi:hypothetical protein
MYVVYKEELWSTDLWIHGNHLGDYKASNPNKLIFIVKGGETKLVPANQLHDYSIWRNMNALGKLNR